MADKRMGLSKKRLLGGPDLNGCDLLGLRPLKCEFITIKNKQIRKNLIRKL